MKNMKKYIILAVCSFFLLAPFGAAAKSVMWTEQKEGFGSGGSASLGTVSVYNPIFQVTYTANVRNLDTDTLLQDDDTVPIGARIRFEPKPYEDTDTFWFRTGGVYDSPYGYFTENAAPPSAAQRCSDADILTGGTWFASFTVAPPPTISVLQSGSANLSCDNSGRECIVNSGGTIKSRVSFQNTIGKVYIFYTGSAVDYGKIVGSYRCGLNPHGTGGDTEHGSTYRLTIPTQTIPFILNAGDNGKTAANRPPTTPVITGPTLGKTGIPYSFSALSTDPDNDTIRYGFDWNNDTTVDQWLPADGYVNSGVSQSGSRTWSLEGANTFKVLAQDSKNANSPWVSHTITLTYCSPEEGNACTTSPNSCGMTSTGTISCTGACSAVTPTESLCTPCYPDCSRRGQVCVGKTFNDANGCGINNCDGTRSCDYNWKEVAP
ncbi:MAG: hypothetical protein AAB547_03595 [Patescibacteria group bacterium]